MNKAKIEKLARDKRKPGGANKGGLERPDFLIIDDPQSAQERAGARGVILDPSSVAALSGAIVEGIRAALIDIGPTLARIAASDTLHSLEKPATILRRAIDEGNLARALFDESKARGVYAQKWDCWVIRQFYFQFFKESPHCSP